MKVRSGESGAVESSADQEIEGHLGTRREMKAGKTSCDWCHTWGTENGISLGERHRSIVVREEEIISKRDTDLIQNSYR